MIGRFMSKNVLQAEFKYANWLTDLTTNVYVQ
jgi:hypothetical protein